MPGWSWWLIWAVLVVALVLVVVFGIRRVLAAYRRARVEGDRLNGLLGQLTASVDELSEAGRRVEELRTSALFGSRADLAAAVEDHRLRRVHRRQARRDRRIARGRLITHSAEHWTDTHV